MKTKYFPCFRFWLVQLCFLGGAFINKRARLSQSLVFVSRQTRSDQVFVQFVHLNEYLGNRSRLSQMVPPFSFYFLSVTYTKPDETKGSPFSIFFGAVRLFFDFFCLQRTTFVFIEVRARNIQVKRYIRTLNVLSEPFCIFVRRRHRSESRSFA